MIGAEIVSFFSGIPEGIGTVVGSVVGALFTAIFLRRNTKTDEFEKIKAGKFKEVADDLLDSGKMTYMEYYKANNFLSIAKKADLYYQEPIRADTTASCDFDWFVRFFEEAGNVSDDTMQNMWAKILAGEIAHPSSFSLKTIDVMKNLSKKDAELFIKICSHSFVRDKTNWFLPNEDEYLKSVGITYTDILKLNELGLIFNDGIIALNMSVNNEPSILTSSYNSIMLVSSSSGEDELVSIGQFPFTEAGKELSTMTNGSASDEDLLRYGESLSHNRPYKVSVHKVIEWKKESVSYEEENLISRETPATNKE